jgi:hypothetical protein
MTNYTKNDFLEIEDCKCGKRVFKYNNTTKNIFIAKCGYCSDEYDSKSKKWIKSKKKICNFLAMYHGPRPVFAEIKNKVFAPPRPPQDPNKILEEQLRVLFKFLFVSSHTSTLDEINLLVRLKLKRKERIIYYFPTTTWYMKESHRESFEDYHTRIFSQEIIDLSYIPPPVIKFTKKTKKTVIHSISKFIITESDPESGSDSDSESDSESGSGPESVSGSDTEVIEEDYNSDYNSD